MTADGRFLWWLGVQLRSSWVQGQSCLGKLGLPMIFSVRPGLGVWQSPWCPRPRRPTGSSMRASSAAEASPAFQLFPSSLQACSTLWNSMASSSCGLWLLLLPCPLSSSWSPLPKARPHGDLQCPPLSRGCLRLSTQLLGPGLHCPHCWKRSTHPCFVCLQTVVITRGHGTDGAQ